MQVWAAYLDRLRVGEETEAAASHDADRSPM